MGLKLRVGAVVVSALLLVGCGGEGGEAVSAQGSAGTSATAKDSGAAGDTFCANGAKLALQIESATAKLGTPGGDLRSAFGPVSEYFQQLADKAPKEIKADFQLWAEGWAAFTAVLARYDYDFAKIMADPAAMKALETLGDARHEQASANIEAWLEKNCPSFK